MALSFFLLFKSIEKLHSCLEEKLAQPAAFVQSVPNLSGHFRAKLFHSFVVVVVSVKKS